MTDAVVLGLSAGALGTLQVLGTAWLHYQTNKNACGGAKCVETMTKALNIRTERTPGEVAVSKVAQSSGTNSYPSP